MKSASGLPAKGSGALTTIDDFGILDDAPIRRYFQLGCEVKGLGGGHIQRIKKAAQAERA